MTNLNSVRRLAKSGYYIGKFAGDFWVFYFELSHEFTSIAEYIDWFESVSVVGQSLTQAMLPQLLPLYMVEDVVEVWDWKKLLDVDVDTIHKLSLTLSWSSKLWPKIFKAWAEIEPVNSFQYIKTMASVLGREIL